MSVTAQIPPRARTWRDIHQDIAPRAMSGEGRKRLAFATLKTIGIISTICVCAWAGYELLRLWEHDPVKLRAPVKNSPVRDIVLVSDGRLDKAWVERTLALPKGADLMELDLQALRARLLAHPQVRTAVLARKFPDKLSVVLEERMPVARVRVPMEAGEVEDYFVARDGVVFPGVNFPAEFTGSFPHLDGLTLRRQGRGFARIAGMEPVSDLLGTARGNTPDLYASWRVVSLAKLSTDGLIVVRSESIPEITFGTRDDFYKQLAQLDLIIDRERARLDAKPIASVNLAVGLSANGILVPVAYAPPPALPTGQPEAVLPAVRGTTSIFQPQRSEPVRSAPRRPSAFFPPARSSL